MTATQENRAASSIGQRVLNVDWQAKTSGAALYTGDIDLPGMLHARILRSPHPHATIRSINVNAAMAVPGVVAIVTGSELPDRTYIHHGGPMSDRRVLAQGTVRFVGEEIAGIAAETAAAAALALRRIDVKYKSLRAATTLQEALEPNAPQIHAKGNVSAHRVFHWGAADPLRPREVSVKGQYRFGRQTHATMETSSIVARWMPEAQILEIWTNTQAPFIVRKEIAHVLDLDLESIVIHEIAVGGGFGAKSKICEYEAIAAALSIKSGRPVKLVLTREEEFTCTKSRHSFTIDLETFATRDGLLSARSAQLLVDNGAYNHSGPSVMANGMQVIASLLRVPDVELDARLVYTNKQPGGQFRGYGGPQVAFAVESQTDEIAAALGMDPVDFRILNANRAGDVTPVGWQIHSARLVECLERARDEIGWAEKKKWAGSGRGVGFAAAIHVSGANIYEGANKSGAAIDITGDGVIRIRFGGADAGTWQKTLLTQFAAEELAVDSTRITVLTMESHQTPHELGAWSSRGTYMSGHAVGTVARKAAQKLRELGAVTLGVDVNDTVLRDGYVVSGDEAVSFARIVELHCSGLLTLEEQIELPIDAVNRETGVANISGAYAFAVQAVEVEVDRETGKVKVIDAVSVHDSGIAINPIGMESQIVGGMAMGIGLALGEELLFEGGQSMTRSYISYPLPRADDLPPIRSILIEEVDPNGPYGAKGVGEIVLVPTGAAVANAIAHATGVRLYELPATPDRVLAALHGGTVKRGVSLWRRPSRWWIEGMRRAYPLGAHWLLHRIGRRFARPVAPLALTAIERPASVEETAAALTTSGSRAIGGGTDFMPARRQGVATASTLVDLTVVPGLSTIATDGSGLLLGAAARLDDVSTYVAGTPFEVIQDAIDQIANPQIRSMATVGGNLCQLNRCWFLRNDFMCYKRGGASCPCYAVTGDHRFYHAVVEGHRCQSVTPSDLSTILTAMNAEVNVMSAKGPHKILMTGLYKGPGETVLASGEFIQSILIPHATAGSGIAYAKLNRSSGDFAMVSAAASLTYGVDGVISRARVVLGAVAPTPWVVTDAEEILVGSRSEDSIAQAAKSWVHHAHPLAGNEWKVDAATSLLERVLRTAAERAKESGA
jgi:CO/xanthine dehydrogenase Mo-binding subunit/CO/xanthine dehydrogenase FAD-binding subunit